MSNFATHYASKTRFWCRASFLLTEFGKYKEDAPKDLNKTNKNPKENPYQPMDFKNLKKKCQKSEDFCQMFVISKKKTIPYGMD